MGMGVRKEKSFAMAVKMNMIEIYNDKDKM